MAGSKSMSKVVVIGAGVGGMATAARLAKAGHKVSIYEAANRTGGKCRTEWIDGFAFDTGPSLLTLPAVYKDLFLKTGKRLEHALQILPVDPAFSYRFADGKEVTFPNLSHHKTRAAIEASFGKTAGDEWHKIMRRAERMWSASRVQFVESEMNSFMSLFKSRTLLRDLIEIAPVTSLRKLTNRYTSSPYLSKIIDRYATYTGSDPRQVPAVLLTIAFVEEAFGAWHLKGGIGKLSEALEERCINLGVQIFLSTPVKEILHQSGRVTGIQLSNGENIKSDIVVTNTDSTITYSELLPNQPKITRKARRNLAKSIPSLAGFSLLIGLKADSFGGTSLSHHNVFFPENYDDEFDAIFKRKEPVPDPAIYICAPKDEEMVTNPGDENLFVLVNAPRHEPGIGCDWNKIGLKESYAELIIDKLAEKGVDIRDRIVVMEIRTPADLESSTNAPGGSIYGTSSNGVRSAFRRAKNRSPLAGLYCVGGSAHPGGGLPLVGISAEIVANAIGKA